MSASIPFRCPYCDRDCTIIAANYAHNIHYFNNNNKDGKLGLETIIIVCPNPECKEYSIEANLYRAEINNIGNFVINEEEQISNWKLKPQSSAKIMPNYIPDPIVYDYQEACLILNLSPKASATLSRRCIQGMIRDFWSISKPRLIEEINALKDKIDPTTWQAIDAIRSIGNIGAHMEKDINLVIDVEQEEANLLIKMIEILIQDWYINRHERQKHLSSIITTATQKAADRAGA